MLTAVWFDWHKLCWYIKSYTNVMLYARTSTGVPMAVNSPASRHSYVGKSLSVNQTLSRVPLQIT